MKRCLPNSFATKSREIELDSGTRPLRFRDAARITLWRRREISVTHRYGKQPGGHTRWCPGAVDLPCRSVRRERGRGRPRSKRGPRHANNITLVRFDAALVRDDGVASSSRGGEFYSCFCPLAALRLSRERNARHGVCAPRIDAKPVDRLRTGGRAGATHWRRPIPNEYDIAVLNRRRAQQTYKQTRRNVARAFTRVSREMKVLWSRHVCAGRSYESPRWARRSRYRAGPSRLSSHDPGQD